MLSSLSVAFETTKRQLQDIIFEGKT